MRRLTAGLVTSLLAVAGAACGDDDDTSASSATQTTAEAPAAEADAAAAFPVDIDHRYGTTTIEARPERVVTVGLTDQDPVLALGVVPVGVTDWFGDHPHAVWPWAQDELGDGQPEIVGTTEGIDFEQVAALRPDLILGVYAGLTESDYETLSQIAPTVAQPEEYVDWGVPWQEQTRIVGRALGHEAEAEALVDEVDQQFADARDAHPEFDGATALVATPEQGAVWVFAPQDSRGRFLTGLGFEMPAEIGELSGDGFGATVSMERVDLLEVDALVWILEDVEAGLAELRAEPLYGGLDVVAEGRDLGVPNSEVLGGATTFQTVLSLPALLDGLVPLLAAAVDGDPETTA